MVSDAAAADAGGEPAREILGGSQAERAERLDPERRHADSLGSTVASTSQIDAPPSTAQHRAMSMPPGGADVSKPRLWLVRHGETEWAKDGRHTGRTDIPLTGLGRSQAVAVGLKIGHHLFVQVLSSPLSRALETCRIAGFGAHVEVVDDLREWDYGTDEGRTTEEIREERPGWSIWGEGPQGGETVDALGARADRVPVDRPREHADLPGDCLG